MAKFDLNEDCEKTIGEEPWRISIYDDGTPTWIRIPGLGLPNKRRT